MSFDTTFPGVAYFGEGCYVLSRSLFPTKEEALAEITNYLREEFEDPEWTPRPSRLRETTVLWRRAADEELPDNGRWKPGDLIWLLGESGKFAKKVWCYEA